MRKIGDQWIEIIDGQKHMVKAVAPIELCKGCLFNCNQGGCCWKGFDNCQMGSFFIIKDLGILNKDGCLPCPLCGEYPRLAMFALRQNEGAYYYAYCNGCGSMRDENTYHTKQEAIDAWNRRV